VALPRPVRPSASREARPALLPVRASDQGGWVDLPSYGVIGNQRTAALVSRFGSVDWACFPTFSSPSVFGRLLDRRTGGYHRIAPELPAESRQKYVPGTNVLRTIFVLSGEVQLSVTDFMPVAPAYVSRSEDRIVRLVEATGGHVRVQVQADVRFDYGRVPNVGWKRPTEALAVASAQGHAVHLAAPGPWSFRGTQARTTFELAPDEPLFCSIDWGEGHRTEDDAAILAATVRYWRSWARQPDAPFLRAAHVWADWVERSELLLKLLSDRETGAFIAAPTTSLPEWIGGPRNWDYRFAWARDAAFSAQILILLGHVREARDYAQWIVDRLGNGRQKLPLGILYDVSGRAAHREEVLGHWEGYRCSRPVRIGNAAATQAQHDIYGEVLDVMAELAPLDLPFVRRNWPALSTLVHQALRAWTKPDAGIWESRDVPAHYVHSKVMCWVAVDRAAQISERIGASAEAAKLRREAERMRTIILARGFDPDRQTFVQAFDRETLDASVLRIPLTGFLPYDDPRVRGTVRAIESQLARGPFVYRDDTSGAELGPEGAFLLCSFWLVECLARGGERERAARNFRQLLKVAGPLRLFPEQYDPVRGEALGNYPQSFTHIGVLRAALAIGTGREEGEGAGTLPSAVRDAPNRPA
jgi:GH15 family glucan-1,4-alpha-glucosidase